MRVNRKSDKWRTRAKLVCDTHPEIYKETKKGAVIRKKETRESVKG